jgi:hypothetical protein
MIRARLPAEARHEVPNAVCFRSAGLTHSLVRKPSSRSTRRAATRNRKSGARRRWSKTSPALEFSRVLAERLKKKPSRIPTLSASREVRAAAAHGTMYRNDADQLLGVAHNVVNVLAALLEKQP